MTTPGGNGTGHVEDHHISIQELINRINTSCDGMSPHNPHRVLFQQCRVAIIYLAQRVPDEELKQSVIITPGGR